MCQDCGCGHTEPSGEITHFYKKPMVAVAKLTESIKVGDTIKIQGATSDFSMTVNGLRNDKEKEVEKGEKDDLVAFKVTEIARPGDKLWLVMREVAEE